MNDTEYAAQKARIDSLITRWHTCLGLRWWKVHHSFERGDYHSNGDYAPSVVANTAVKWEYMDASITWNLQAVENLDHDELEYAFVHECCHVLVNEMRVWHRKDSADFLNEMEREHEERVVTQLAKAFLWTRYPAPITDEY